MTHLVQSGSQARREDMRSRLVRYAELQPCTTAFVDTRTPGSTSKENFTIIGPGVAENPDQHVHIRIPHGFNIGGARQPPHSVNSQHSHATAEVFVIHTGLWRMKTGHDGSDGSVDLGPGDVISFPTRMFRGFENIGSDTGFLFAVLGGDDPGRVTWAPYVFEAARNHGLVLLETGRLVDTRSEELPADARPMPPTTMYDVARFDRYDSAAAEGLVVRASAQSAAGRGLNRIAGFAECPLIGVDNPLEEMPAGRIAWEHGFQVRALRVMPGARSGLHVREEEEVLLGHAGDLTVSWAGGELEVGPGDTFSIPPAMAREFSNRSAVPAWLYVVRGRDLPAAPVWTDPLHTS